MVDENLRQTLEDDATKEPSSESRTEHCNAALTELKNGMASSDNAGASNDVHSDQPLNGPNEDEGGSKLSCSKLVDANLRQIPEDVATKESLSEPNSNNDFLNNEQSGTIDNDKSKHCFDDTAYVNRTQCRQINPPNESKQHSMTGARSRGCHSLKG